jgi:phosphatidylglycerophosphate synthase
MLSIKALAKLNDRSGGFSAYLSWAGAHVNASLENVRSRPGVATALARFVAFCHGPLFLALALAYLPARPADCGITIAVTLAASVALYLLALLSLGLLRGNDGRPVRTLELANKLTIVRFVLVAPIVMLILHDKPLVALVAYVICSGTDVADGIVARRNREITRFGVIMDPLADIVSTAGVFGAFLAKGLIPQWVFIILMLRYGSLFIGAAILFLAVGPMRFKATPVGKIVGVLQALAAILIIALSANAPDLVERFGNVLYPFLGMIFGSVIVSQLVIGIRHIRKGGGGECVTSKEI